MNIDAAGNTFAIPERTLHRVLGWAVPVLLVAAPLPFAGRTPEASALLCAAACGTGLLALAGAGGRGKIPAAGALAGFCLLALLTVAPLPAPIVRLLNPASAAWQEAALGVPAPSGATLLTLSSTPSATAATLGRVGAALALFFAACALARQQAGRRRIASALVASGLLQAALGFVMFVQDRNRIFGYTREAWLGRLTGTYINPNHFAGLIELAAPLALAVLLGTGAPGSAAAAGLRPPRSARGARRWRRIAETLSDRRAPLRLFFAGALALMLVALLLSGSRGGVALCAAALLPPSFVAARGTGGRFPARVVQLAVIAAVSLGLVLALFGANELTRLSGSVQQAPTDLLAPGGRLDAWARAAPILVDHPVTGSGLGSFADVFPRYRGPEIRFRYEELHNDWLQLAVETGLAGFLLILIALVAALRAARAALRAERDVPLGDTTADASPSARRTARLLRVGALSGAAALLVHEAFEFNLQIPANALAFAAIVAVGTAGLSGVDRMRPRPLKDDAIPGRPRNSASLVLGMIAVLLAGWGAWRPSDRAIAEVAAGRDNLVAADLLLSDPLRGGDAATPENLISKAREHFSRAARGNPAIPDTMLLRARLERIAAVIGGADRHAADEPDNGAWRLTLAAHLDPYRADLRADLLAERLARGDLEGALDDLRALAARGGESLARILPLLLSAEPDGEAVEQAILDGARERGEVGEGDGWGDARLLYPDALTATGRSARALDWLRRMINAKDAPDHILAGAYHRWLSAAPAASRAVEAVPLGRSILARAAGAPPSESATIHSGLARALLAAGDPCAAATEADAALALLPAQPGVRLEAAGYSLACGRADEAARRFEYLLRGGAEAAFVAGNEVELRSGLARAYERLGRREDALREWRLVARLAPNDAGARDRVLMLESGL